MEKIKEPREKIEYYHNKTNSLYDDDKLDEKDIDELDYLRNNMTQEYTTGKINKEQYDKLVDEISINYNRILKNELDSLDNILENYKETKLADIQKKVKDIHNKGKINNEQFNELKKEISIIYADICRKKIDTLDDLKKEDTEKQIQYLKDEIDDAYSKEKITELHYNILQKKISRYEK